MSKTKKPKLGVVVYRTTSEKKFRKLIKQLCGACKPLVQWDKRYIEWKDKKKNE